MKGILLWIGGLLLLALVALPVMTLLVIALSGASDSWRHLTAYVLPVAVVDTFLVMTLVAVGTIAVGTGTAWLTSLCRFPGRSFFGWALVLPLAVPTYIAAYSFVEFLDYSGPVQNLYRSLAGIGSGQRYAFPDIRSVGGAGLVFTAVLYPYVYLTSRLVFAMQGASAIETSRSLGAKPFKVFWRIALPMARPALAAGAALALMEVLNDIGAVEHLGVRTLGFAVFETWLNRNDLGGAVQLALITLAVVALLVVVERTARRERSYATSTRERPAALIDLSPTGQIFAFTGCALSLLVGLGIPLFVLGSYALRRLGDDIEPALAVAAGNSLMVALATATIATAIAYAVLQLARIFPRGKISLIGRLASLGYAIPGTVLAIGLLIPLAAFDNWLDGLLRSSAGISSGLLLSGTVAIVIYACTLRFLAVAYGTVEAGFARVSPSYDMAARALGRSSWRMTIEVHAPVLKRALAAAFLLVFVDTMKELPATLLLRPFGFESLPTLIYTRASQSALEDGAIAALAIIAIGMIPMILLSGLASKSTQKKARTSLSALRNS
ncbi:MAG: ABC transporter permease [Rhizobiaceae bacterium]